MVFENSSRICNTEWPSTRCGPAIQCNEPNYDLYPNEGVSIKMSISKEVLLSLIEAGVKAPSPDNMQPWKFRLTEDGFELWLDRTNMGLFFDVNEVATQIGCGALVENISLRAISLGLSLQLELDNTPTDRTAVFKFSLSSDLIDDGLVDAIDSRATDRRLYQRSRRVDQAIRDELTATVGRGDDFHLVEISAQKSHSEINRIVMAADTIRFDHEAVHHGFYDVLRFGADGDHTRDGLAEKTLGIEFFFMPVLKLLRSWSLTRGLNRVGLHYLMAARGAWLPMVTAPHIFALIHDGEADYFSSGRALQRFWLKAAQHQLSVQPLGALPLFLARLHQASGEGFSSRQREILRQLDQRLAGICPSYSGSGQQLVMLFRVGYASGAVPRAWRRPVESFLLE